jgi:hypothetical protein
MDAMSDLLASLAAEHRLPGVYTFRHYVDAGGLMSYGPSLPGMIRIWAGYVDKILKGARAGRPARADADQARAGPETSAPRASSGSRFRRGC